MTRSVGWLFGIGLFGAALVTVAFVLIQSVEPLKNDIQSPPIPKAEDSVPSPETTESVSPDRVDLQAFPERPFRISGILLDEESRRLSNVSGKWSLSLDSRILVPDTSFHTDAKGRFEDSIRLRIPTSAESLTLHAQAVIDRELAIEATQSYAVKDLAPSSELAIILRYDSRRRLLGRVLDVEGHPVDDARLILRPLGSGRPRRFRAPEGSFSLTLETDGQHTLSAYHDAVGVSDTYFLDLDAATKKTTSQDVVLIPRGVITGLVHFPDDQPVQDLELVATHEETERPLQGSPSPQRDGVVGRWQASQRTDAHGRFRFASLQDGNYTLAAPNTEIAIVARSGDGDVRILWDQYMIRVAVKSPNGDPCLGAKVHLKQDIPDGHSSIAYGRVNALGQLTLAVQPGYPVICVARYAGHRADAEFDIVRGVFLTDVEVVMEQKGSVLPPPSEDK